MASPWSNTLVIPLYIGAASAVALCLQILLESAYFKAILPEPESPVESSISDHILKHGGHTIFAFKTARLLGCLVLLGLSTAALVLDQHNPHLYLQSAMCAIYFYTAVLAILSVSASAKWSGIFIKHLNTILLSLFSVYFYRDIFPLATLTLLPMDLCEGRLLYPKVLVLFAVSVVVPLAIPRQYTPIDPKHPMPTPNAEQTAPLTSLALYFFLDPVIFLAHRIPHLSFDQLPPLCDYDAAAHLKAKTFPVLDPAAGGRRRHIALGLLWLFRGEFAAMALLLAVTGLASFVSPLALNRLLTSLEDPVEAAALTGMQPWFWILLLFLGPATYVLAFQWDIWIGTHMMAQASAVLTQLVFEHSLRVRVRAEPAAADKDKDGEKNQNLMGRINTLVTVDLGNVGEARNVLFIVVLVPIHVVGSVVFLYQVLGWSAFVGLGVMVALFPLPGYVARLQSKVQETALEKTDARVQIVSELVNVVRMIKMFGWEKEMDAKIAEKRTEELTWIWWRKVLKTASGITIFLVPCITMLATYATYTLLMKEDLSAAKVFSSMAVFDLLRGQMWFTSYCISMIVKAKVSLDRLDDFLTNTELLDAFTPTAPGFEGTIGPGADPDAPAADLIGFRDAVFSWANDDDDADRDGTRTPASRRFRLRIEGALFFKPGCINLIAGPTGSGKTSLLMALLGEMHLTRASPGAWLNLPRGGGVSFAEQQGWVLNDTIKNNILFNAPMDAERYRKVVYQCCLERDLELFEAGDETEVGEKGLTLSGGQKARVSLARAVYADSQIVLLDDVLAALDVHTAKWVVEKCLRGDLIKNRTVLLVTHNVAMASKVAQFVVTMGLDGRIHSQAPTSEALANDEILAAEVVKDQAALKAAEAQIDAIPADEPKMPSGKLIMAEEIEIGSV